MDDQQFHRAINNGLGRAILWLRDNPWRPHIEAIEHVCRHTPAYDPQCEGSRAEYVYEIICLTDDPQHFVDLVIKELLEAKENWDIYHLFDLARLFARDGHERARQAMYERFERNEGEEAFVGEEHLIALDGTDGLLIVLDRIGRHLADDPTYVVEDWHLRSAEEELGETQVRSAIQQAAQKNPNIQRYIKAAGPQEQEGTRRSKPEHWHWTYAQVKERLERGELLRGRLLGWGRKAKDDDLRQAAEDLLRMDDPQFLIAYLRMFHSRPFPLDPRRLIELADSDQEELAQSSRRALCNVGHPEVRQLAVDLMERGEVDGDVVGLLTKSYQPGDHQLVQSVLERSWRESDEDNSHWVAHQAVNVFAANPGAEAVASLLQVYEQVRCSLCRMGAVEVLLKLKRVPEWMAEECQYDSYDGLRELFGGRAD